MPVSLPSLGLTSVFTVIKKLSLGVLLIAAAAAVLLGSDLASRGDRSAASHSVFNVAIVQHASQVVMEDGLRGVLTALKARGYWK